MEAAGTVLEVLSVSFGTLQKAVAGRPREPGARANAGGRRWKLQGRFWRAKGARREQLMQVEGQEPVREGFGGAIRQFRNHTKSCG